MPDLSFKILAENMTSGAFSNVKSEIAGAEQQAQSASGHLGGLGSALGNVAQIASGFAIGGGLMELPGKLMEFTKAAQEDEAATMRLQQAVRNLGGDYDAIMGDVNKAIAAGQKLAFTDDDVRDSYVKLSAATGDSAEALARQQLAMDLARGAGIPLMQASTMLGKINEDNIQVFKRMGITLGDNATEADALAAVQKKFGGQADAYAKSTAGQFEQTKIALSETEESIGYLILPVMSKLAQGLVTVTEKSQEFVGALQNAQALGDAFDGIKAAIDWLGDHKEILAGAALGITAALIPAFIGWSVAAGAAAVATIAATAPVLAIGVAAAALGIGIVELITHWDDVTAAMGHAKDAILGFAGDVLDYLKNNWLEVLGDILLGPIFIFRDQIRDVLEAAWGKAKDAIQSGISGIRDLVEALPGHILDWLGDLGSLLFDSGKQIIDGLIRGFLDKFGDIKDTLGDLKDKIVSWKGPLEEDAVLLTPAGVAIMNGLQTGLESRYAAIQQSLHNFTSTLLSDVLSAIGQMQLAAQGAAAGLIGGGVSGGAFYTPPNPNLIGGVGDQGTILSGGIGAALAGIGNLGIVNNPPPGTVIGRTGSVPLGYTGGGGGGGGSAGGSRGGSAAGGGSAGTPSLSASAQNGGPLTPQDIALLLTMAGATDPDQIATLTAIAMWESGGSPRARSSAGAQGLFQFMPGTAQMVGLGNPNDPAAAAAAALRLVPIQGYKAWDAYDYNSNYQYVGAGKGAYTTYLAQAQQAAAAALGGGVGFSTNYTGSIPTMPTAGGVPTTPTVPAIPQPDFAGLQANINATLNPLLPASMILRLGQTVGENIEAGNIPGAIGFLSQVPQANFFAVVDAAHKEIEDHAKAAGLSANQLATQLGQLAQAEDQSFTASAQNGKAPFAAPKDAPLVDFGALQAQIEASLHPDAPSSLILRAGDAVAEAIESGNQRQAIALLGQVPGANFFAVVSGAQQKLQADARAAGLSAEQLTAQLQTLQTAEAGSAGTSAQNGKKAFGEVAALPDFGTLNAQIEASLHPDAPSSLILRASEAVAGAIESGQPAQAIAILSALPADNFMAVITGAGAKLQADAHAAGLSAAQLTGQLGDLQTAEASSVGTSAANGKKAFGFTEAPDFSTLQAEIDATLHPNAPSTLIKQAGDAVALAIEQGDMNKAVALLSAVPPDNFFAVVSEAEAELSRAAKNAGLTAAQLNGRLGALAGIETGAAKSSAASGLPAYSDKPPIFGAPEGGVKAPSLAFGANAATANAAGGATATTATTTTGPTRTTTSTAAGTGTNVQINVSTTPTSASDPAMADLVRAIDQYLKRTGHPAGLGV